MVDPTSAAPSSIAGKYLTVNTDNAKYAYLGIDNDGSHVEGYVKNQTDPIFGEIQVMGELGAQTALDFQFL